LDPATSAFFRSLPLAVKILLGMNYALIAAEAAIVLVLLLRPDLRLRERRVSVISAHPLTLWAFLLFSLNRLLFMISTAMFPSISAGRYEFPIGIYRVEARDLFWFLLCLALLPLTRRRFRLTPHGLDAVTSFGCKRFVRWDDVASLHFSKLFGFVLKLADGRRLYLPGALHGLASFSEEAAARLPADRMTVRATAKISAYRARLF
jgi:hypothetical protein